MYVYYIDVEVRGWSDKPQYMWDTDFIFNMVYMFSEHLVTVY